MVLEGDELYGVCNLRKEVSKHIILQAMSATEAYTVYVLIFGGRFSW